MDRRSLWPDFRPQWIVYEDDDIIAVDKPPGVPTMDADGLPARLTHWLSVNLGTGQKLTAYLGIHQRLDRETSGVVVYAKRREANAGLARQFEGRAVEKTYVAAVSGWPVGGERTLRDRLGKGRDGRMRVDARGKLAVTHARETARRDGRSLLEVRIETGRTHQIRVQLAHAGSPVAGDSLYGGARASRLMLHAASLELEHPVTGAALRLEAPVPWELSDWLEHGEIRFPRSESVSATLHRAAERRWALGRSEDTTAFRLANADGDGLPGLALDVYGDWLVAHVYEGGGATATPELLDALDGLGFDGVYLKVRPRQANRLVDTRRDDLAPAAPVRGRPAPDEITVLENGMPFVARLGDGLGTGLFLDQRENRRRVRELARGATVLNLFAYTCPFTVAAALGGATRTVSVDVSAPALERGERYVRALGTAGEHGFVRDDAFGVLRRLARGGDRFDLVVVDPPTYSTTKKTRWKSGRDWVRLAEAALAVVAPGGRLLACSNDQRMRHATFRKYLRDALRAAGRRAEQVKDLPDPTDFPVPAGTEPHLSSVLITLA